MTVTKETTIWCDGVDGTFQSCGQWEYVSVHRGIDALIRSGWKRYRAGVHRCPECKAKFEAKTTPSTEES